MERISSGRLRAVASARSGIVLEIKRLVSVSHNHLCERRLSVVVVVVGSAAHRNHFSDSKGSEWYTNKVVELLTRRGYDIVQRLSAFPDDDFVYW